MNDAAAGDLAAQMLLWLARAPERLQAFMRATGADARTILDEAESPWLHMAVLDFLLADEALLMQFCAETGTDPQLPARIWNRLRGGVDGA